MQDMQNSASVPPIATLSLEDRLRTMIQNHEQHHQSRRSNLDFPPSQMLLPLHETQPPPSFRQPPLGSPLPPPLPQYTQNVFPANPPLSAPLGPAPRMLPGPGPAFCPSAPVPRSPGAAIGHPLSYQRHLPVQAHGSRPGPRYPPHHNSVVSVAPPPSSLDHFPPLGKEIPKKKPWSLNSPPAQPADQPHGQRNPNARSWRPPVTHYEQFFAEQAFNLDQLASTLLNEIAPPESEISFRRKLLQDLKRICQQLSPTAKLVPFGSLVTGFATASSDIDCVFFPGSEVTTEDEFTELPSLLEKKLQEEGFNAQLLTRTRVPIIKMVQKPTAENPQEIQCDIGFRNHLAIRNTHLLLSYSECDARVKQMVLVIKWWAKKRHINSPYRGTLSSYGYVLMILHYLINIVQPPVLPNLQLQRIPENTSDDEIYHKQGENIYNIWFSQDTESIQPSLNTSTLGELLRGFFDYYSYKFGWGQSVISIRTEGGLLSKQDKGWTAAKSRAANTVDGNETWEVKDRYLFALEDPFETSHNVGRTCNGPGVARIRDELRRAMSLIKIRGDRGRRLARFLCEEAPPERPFVRREERNPDQQEAKSPTAPDSPATHGETTEEMSTGITQTRVGSTPANTQPEQR